MPIYTLWLIRILIATVAVALPIMIITWAYRKNKAAQKAEWFSRMRFVVLRILVPKLNDKTPQAAEQMFAALHGIYRAEMAFQDYISFEIAARDKYIYFYVCVPTHLKDFVQGQIYAQYPTAEIMEVNDYTMDEYARLQKGELKIAGADLQLVNNDVFPIKTFMSFEVDPLSGITGVLSKVDKDEQVWIQMIIRPVNDSWHKKGMTYISRAKEGKLTNPNILAEIIAVFFHFLAAIAKAIFENTAQESKRSSEVTEVKLSSSDESGLKGVETKATKLGFATKMRVIVMTNSENAARSKIASIVGAFKQFNVINLNGFQASPVSTSLDYWAAYQKRWFVDDGSVLNIEELASIYHLPSINVTTPNIVWAGAKKGEPPANLPIADNIDSDDLAVFAKTNFRHLQHKFGIKTPDRRFHMYIVGQTGVGKSTMIENMAIDDINEGRGIAVVDPHGDLINHIMDHIPEERIKDVVYFAPSDRMFPVAFNPLEQVDEDLKSLVASGVVGIFKKIFGESWGPRLEYILRNTVLALLDYPNATMLGVTRILVDRAFREKVVSQVKDPVIKDFFVNEFEAYDPKFRTEAIAPIQNKVGQFLSSSTIRNIIGQPKSTVDIEKIMNTGKILLVNLSIGEIGEDASQLLGALMITKIQLAAMRRAIIPEEQRRDFYLYVDEFQNFATDSFAVILSEARKYHLNLIMTHQYIAQMEDKVREAVLGNVGTTVSFRVGVEDAPVLEKAFEPIFTGNDLVNLPNHHIYVKMSIDGVSSQPFSATTLPRSATVFHNREQIIDASRAQYSRSREFVENQIEEISSLPKVDEILTKQEKKLIPKAPPKVGETYYREIQTPGDVRWYLGGGTEDQPLTEETVQEKIQKTEEKAKEIEEKRKAELDNLNNVQYQWEKDRSAALEPEKPAVVETPKEEPKIGETLPVKPITQIEPAPVHEIVPQTIPEAVDNELEADKQFLSKTLKTSDTKPLEEGQTIDIKYD